MDVNTIDQLLGGFVPEESKDFSPLPDGKYSARVESLIFGATKETMKPMFTWDLVIVTSESGKNIGRHIFHNQVLGNDVSVRICAQSFHNVGIDGKSIADFRSMSGELLDKIIEIQLKTTTKNGKEYQNTYINRLAEDVAGEMGKEEDFSSNW